MTQGRILYARGENVLEIATRLNQAAHTTDSAHPDFRSDGSVRAKLKELGVIEERPRTHPPSVYYPEYGFLKKEGVLVPATAMAFIFDHHDKSDGWIAERLGVELTSLQAFMKRHFIVRLNQGARLHFQRALPTKHKAADLLNRYGNQISAVDAYLDWMVTNHRAPISNDFAFAPGKLALNHGQFFGTGDHRIAGGRYANQRIFDNPEQAYRFLRTRAEQRGVSTELIDLLPK